MRQMVAAMAAALLVCGCVGGTRFNRAMDYNTVSSVPFDVPGDDVYKVFDKPTESRLMISPSYAKTVGLGVVSGATLRTVDVLPQKQFEGAALGYLASTGRTCRILSGELVLRPSWELQYDCSTAEPPQLRR
jgi:hypothetical protein